LHQNLAHALFQIGLLDEANWFAWRHSV
jgi:hypothetical protein